MNVSNVSSTTNPWQTEPPGVFGQRKQDFKSLATALQSGDISSAQSAFATLQNDLKTSQGTAATSPLLDPNTQAGQDFKALQDALKSNDVKAAQDAFKTLKTDLQSARRAHHHHRAANDGNAAPVPAPDASGSATSASALDAIA